MFTGTTLKEHFESDNFFDHSDTLVIIDDYNIFGIKSDAINFYVDNFNKVGCNTILIYFQVDFDGDKDYVDFIYELAINMGLTIKLFMPFIRYCKLILNSIWIEITILIAKKTTINSGIHS